METQRANDLFNNEGQANHNGEPTLVLRSVDPEDAEQELQLTLHQVEEQVDQLEDAQVVRQETMDEMVSM